MLSASLDALLKLAVQDVISTQLFEYDCAYVYSFKITNNNNNNNVDERILEEKELILGKN